MATESTESLAVLGYLAVMARWKWLIIGITVACVAAGFAYLVTRTPLYVATAKLLYVQPVTITNSLVQGSQSPQQPDLATVSAMVASSQVNSAAAELLKGKDTSAGYDVNAAQPTDSAGNLSANVLGIQAVSTNLQTAAAAANACAQAFVDYRRETARAQVNNALTAIDAQLKSYVTPSDKLSAEYLQLKQSQQALELQLQSLSSDFTVIAQASVPTAPFSPRPRHTLVLAAILGLVLGMGLAFLLEQLDTRVRDERPMNEMFGVSSLGHLPALKRRTPEGANVEMIDNPSGPMAEAVRVLRGNLSFVGVDGDVRSVLVTSSIRSEGKSVAASNLAVSMALAGQRVVLVDADFRRPRIHTYLRVSNAVGLSSVLARRAELLDAVIPIALEGYAWADDESAVPEALTRDGASARVMTLATSGRGADQVEGFTTHQSRETVGSRGVPLLRVLPSGPLPPNPGEMAASQRFGEIISVLADTADLVIIDSPPILEVGDAAAMAAKTDGVVFVVNMGRVRWPMLERSNAQLEKFPCRKLGLVVVAAKSAHKPVYGYKYQAGSSPRGAAPPVGRS